MAGLLFRQICRQNSVRPTRNPNSRMKDEETFPSWLTRARSRWPKEPSARGLDPLWTPRWIKNFLGYLKARNGGELPGEPPRYGIVDAYCRFLGTRWKAEDWKIEQARTAVEWLLDAAAGEGGGPGGKEGSPMPIRPEVEFEPCALPARRSTGAGGRFSIRPSRRFGSSIVRHEDREELSRMG